MATQHDSEQINNYINNECYKCCGLKRQHVELSKLNLSANVVNNIVDYHYNKDDECNDCQVWRINQDMINLDCKRNTRCKRNINVDILAFVRMYQGHLPDIDYVRKVVKISQKRYDIYETILWTLRNNKVENTMEYVKQYIRD